MYMFTSGIVLIQCFLLATVSSLPFSLSFSENVPFESIVIFGDSLSDNGNVYALTNETYPIPPYWKGRYSNGPNWVDQLNLSGVSDYAYGSATTDNNLVQGYTKGNTVPVPGMLQQVEIYLNSTNVNEIDFERTLYILWGGNNDFIFDFTLYPDVIVASLLKSAQSLLDIGAKNLLVFNQVPVQYFPFTKPFGAPELFIYLTEQANFHLLNFTESIQINNPQASLKIFDIHSLILNIVTENSTNFTNTADNCWENVNVTTVLQFCTDPDEYFFVDTLHFTSRAHGLIADAVSQFLLESYQTSTNSTTSSSSSYQTSTSSTTSSSSSYQTSTSSTTSSSSSYQTSTSSTTSSSSSYQTSTSFTTSSSSSYQTSTSFTTSSSSSYQTSTNSTTSSSSQSNTTSTNNAVTFISHLNFKNTFMFCFFLHFYFFNDISVLQFTHQI